MFGSEKSYSKEGGSNLPKITTLRAGSYQAIISFVAFLPDQVETFQGETKTRDKLAIGFQSSRKLVLDDGTTDPEGRCYSWSDTYTLSLNEKATLLRDFKHLLGDMTEAKVADIARAILGQQVTISTTLKESVKDGKPVSYSRKASVGAPSDEITCTWPETADIPQWVAKKWPECLCLFWGNVKDKAPEVWMGEPLSNHLKEDGPAKESVPEIA